MGEREKPMATGNQKKRLCWNCDGTVDVHLSHCTYCGAELLRNGGEYLEESAHEEPLQDAGNQYNEDQFEEADEEELAHAPLRQRSLTLPFMLLVPGTLLSLFGLMVWLFSRDGALELRWDASYWYVYVLLALPLLIFGWRSLGRDEAEESYGE
jgi:hypothetical protein